MKWNQALVGMLVHLCLRHKTMVTSGRTVGSPSLLMGNPCRCSRMVYKWVPKPQPSSSASSNNVTKPVEGQTRDPQLCKESKPVEPKLQVWRPKPLNQNKLPQLTKLPEIQASAIPTSPRKQQPNSKASASHSTILWRSRLLQDLLQHNTWWFKTSCRIPSVLSHSTNIQLEHCTSWAPCTHIPWNICILL